MKRFSVSIPVVILFLLFLNTGFAGPKQPVDWCNLEIPSTATLQAREGVTTYGRVYKKNITEGGGHGGGISGGVGLGKRGSDPATDHSWTWFGISFHADVDGSTPGDLALDEYTGYITAPDQGGEYDFCYRFRFRGGPYTYGDLDGSDNGYSPDKAGRMIVITATPTPTPTPTPAQVNWCILQWPPQATLTVGESFNVFGYVFQPGVTEPIGWGPGIHAQAGIGLDGTLPHTDPSWIWFNASYSADIGNNDEYTTSLPSPYQPGLYDYCFRFRYLEGDWKYGDFDGSDNGYTPEQAGSLTVFGITPTPTSTPTPTPTMTPAIDTVDWCNLNWPPRVSLLGGDHFDAFGLVKEPGETDPPGSSPNIEAQAGIGPDGSLPDSDPSWSWFKASYTRDVGEDDEYTTRLQAPMIPGEYDYCFRFRLLGKPWKYGDYDGSANDYSPSQAGSLTVRQPTPTPTPTPTPSATPTPTPTPGPDEIDWCNLQSPPNVTIDPDATFDVYGQVYKPGVTDEAGQGAGIEAQAGIGTDGTLPYTDPSWTWIDAVYNLDIGDDDEYMASLTAPSSPGNYDYCFRFRLTGGPWKYGDLDSSGNGYSTAKAGDLSVTGQTPTPTPTPTAGPGELDWFKLQEPANATISTTETLLVSGRVLKLGVTDAAGQGPGIEAQAGVGDSLTAPDLHPSWNWLDATYTGDRDRSQPGDLALDEYTAVLGPFPAGSYSLCFRFNIDKSEWYFGDLDGSYNGFQMAEMGVLRVLPTRQELLDALLGKATSGNLDVNEDGIVDMADLVTLISMGR